MFLEVAFKGHLFITSVVGVKNISFTVLLDEKASTVFSGAAILEKGNLLSDTKVSQQMAVKNPNTDENSRKLKRWEIDLLIHTPHT